jgi:TolB-like protein
MAMRYRSRALAALVAVASTYGSSEPSEAQTASPQLETHVVVAFLPFEIQGNATSEVANSMSQRLRELLDGDSRIEVAPAGAEPLQQRVQYLVRGIVYAGEGNRAFISLQLSDAKSGLALWSENYDYRGISADMIAPDIIEAITK